MALLGLTSSLNAMEKGASLVKSIENRSKAYVFFNAHRSGEVGYAELRSIKPGEVFDMGKRATRMQDRGRGFELSDRNELIIATTSGVGLIGTRLKPTNVMSYFSSYNNGQTDESEIEEASAVQVVVNSDGSMKVLKV